MGYVLALIGMGLMVGFSGAGSAIGLVTGGSAAIGMLKKRPEAFGSALALTVFPSSQGLYGFVAFIIYSGSVTPDLSVVQGAVALGAGIAVAAACFASGMVQGKVCANGIAAIGQGHNVLGNTMILAAFPEFYAILSLVAAILMQGLM
ncbi:MAG: ATPase [Chitinispirillaceae bacterium]